MNNIRNRHVGKSKNEKEAYGRMLRTQQAEEPTYEEYESSSTNSVVKEDKGKSSITEPSLRSYKKEANIAWKEIIVGIMAIVFTTVLFLFGMSLNRDVGILYERTLNISNRMKEINNDVKNIRDKLSDLNIKINFLNNSIRKQF